ncbi:MAG: MATE family efflux transporter [Erysipelotrichaceae bacterium]|nr:MATE family efflux transporter [Erysipelotrichaceae bacterium]
MRLRNKRSVDMLNGPLLSNIFIFAVPVMFSSLLQIAFNAADTIIVGKFSGQQALAAVGATGSIVNLLVSLFNGLSVGATIVLAQSIGSGVRDRIKVSVHNSYFLALAGGAILTVVGFALSGVFLNAIGTPADIVDGSLLYMRIYFAGSIPLLVYNFGAAILRSKGDTFRPTVFLTISGIVNVVLNLILVIVFKLGVAGVALATVISETISAIMVTYSLIYADDETRLIPKEISLDTKAMLSILRIGIPAGVQGMMWAISNVAVQRSLNSFNSSVVIAGNTAAANIEGFVYIGMGGFSQACMTFTSQNAGAKNFQRIRKLLLICSALIVSVTFVIALVINLNGSFFLSFYTNDQTVIDTGMIRLRYVVFWLFLNGLLDIPSSSMRGMGYSTMPAILMLLGIVGVRLSWIYLYWTYYPTLEVLYFCYPLSWAVTTILQFGLWLFAYSRFVKKCEAGISVI